MERTEIRTEREREEGGRLTDQERGMERGKTREVEREHG